MFVAFVPFAAFVTTIVQIAVSSTKYSSLSLVMFTDKSTIGIGLIVQFTISVVPRGPITVRLFVKLPKALTLTLIIIVALDFAGMLVNAHLITWPLTLSFINCAPVMLSVLMNCNPFGRLSITSNSLVYMLFPRFCTVSVYSTNSW